jgi:hypothetical protein
MTKAERIQKAEDITLAAVTLLHDLVDHVPSWEPAIAAAQKLWTQSKDLQARLREMKDE